MVGRGIEIVELETRLVEKFTGERIRNNGLGVFVCKQISCTFKRLLCSFSVSKTSQHHTTKEVCGRHLRGNLQRLRECFFSISKRTMLHVQQPLKVAQLSHIRIGIRGLAQVGSEKEWTDVGVGSKL